MIEALHLRHSYGGSEALKGVSFTIRPGEICGYLGPNGAGKTTTVKALVGIHQPTQGEVRIAGHEMRSAPLEAKRRLGYVPDNAAAFSLLTVREYLECVGELHEIEPEVLAARMERFIRAFALGECAGRRIDTLSKGQRQKTVLTAAMLHDPEVLILDEPLTGLDANAAWTVKDLLTGLAERGRAILFCSHVLEVVERMCHRVIVLNHGEIVADGPTAELTARARDGTLATLFRSLTSGPDDSAREMLEALKAGRKEER